jgi:hypothetical protein
MRVTRGRRGAENTLDFVTAQVVLFGKGAR